MKGRVMVQISLLQVIFFSFVCIVSMPSYAAEKAITLTYSDFFPATHKHSILMRQWCKEVEQRTNGKVKVNYYPGATLTPPTQTFDSVSKGIADIGSGPFGILKGRFPLIEVVSLPLGYKNGHIATKLINEYYKKFKPKEFDIIKVMYLHATGPNLIHTKKPVYKLEDLKGVKIKSAALDLNTLKALGVTPVGMPVTEVYDALQKGVVEGISLPVETLQGWKFGEILKYTTENYGSSYILPFYVVMNKKKWESFPRDIQVIFEKINEEWIEKVGELWDELDNEGRDFLLKRSHKFIALSSEENARWAEKVKPVIDEYVNELKAKGQLGAEALEFCLNYLKKQQK